MLLRLNILPRLLSVTGLILTVSTLAKAEADEKTVVKGEPEVAEAEEAEECCPLKMVGSTSYTLLPDQPFQGQKYQMLNIKCYILDVEC